jgi:class 3 adenylate cyclase/tetratricopeptide (TPR) repeat protein
MSEALDPEDLHAVMDGFFALALEAVHAQRGTVNQFRGDGFMALFGAPRARGDDAARALRAALEVRERSREYAESVRARYGVPFAVRIGVSTGRVWVGSIGNELRRDYTAEGPTVGLAARLEALAAPSQILVAEETARRGAGFELLDLGVRSVRGLSEPVRVFELIAEQPHEAQLAADRERGLSPFVGRAAELAQLRRALLRGDGLRCLEVRGEAGIGKSRLVREALRALPPAVVVLELACREASTRRAYRPWLDALRRFPAGLPGGERAAALASRLEGAGPPLAPHEAAGALHDALAELLAARPVVIAIDDAHWIDPSSRALLEGLTAQPPAGALACVATVRTDESGDWGAGAAVERLALGALASQEARRLAELASGGLEPDLIELTCLRGGGNPLFVEEVARALRDGSESLRDAARIEMSLARAPQRVPDTLWGVVAARIDALPEDAKRVLEMAAVVGECFDAELVGDVLAGLDVEPGVLLELLVTRGLLRSAPGGEYDFCHGVVRAGAEAQLVRERLQSLHRRIADALAKRPVAGTASGASRIGNHYDCAGEPQAAIPHLVRAGRAYAELRALLEAVAHLRHAFALLRAGEAPPPALESSVGLALASALAALDRTGEAAAVLESLDVERPGAEDRLRLASVNVQAGWLRFSNENDLTRGRALVERGLRAVLGLREGDETRLIAWSYLARMDLLDGELERALSSVRSAAEHATARGDRASLAFARYNECAVHCEAGRIGEARRAAEDALSLTGERGAAGAHALIEGLAQGALARLHLFEGDPERALAAAGRADELALRSGQLGLRYLTLVVSGYAQLLRGDVRPACESFEALVPLGAHWPSTFLHRARGALESGELAAAAELARRCCEAGAPRAIRARALSVLGLATGLGSGGADAGEALLAEAADLCDTLGLRPWLAESHQFLAELCARRGDTARAAHYAARAAEGFARCGMRAHAERAHGLGEPRAGA